MTTPGAAAPRPAGFSSPMGTGNMAKRASAAAAADLAQLASLSEKYRTNMAEAAKSAKAATAEVKKQADALKLLTNGKVDLGGMDRPRGPGGRFVSRNGGGARMPAAPGRPPAGFPPLEDDAPTNAYLAASRRNGGGARFGGRPAGGVGASAAFIPGLGGVDGGPTPTIPNAGGASFPVMPGWIGAAAKTAGAAGAAAAGAALMDPDNYRSADFVANRMARISTGGYDKRLGGNRINQYFGGSFRSQAEMQAMALPVISQGGFAAGTAGFSTVAGNAAMAARLNPLLGGAQAGQLAVNMQNPQLFNMARMTLGVETIGRGGQARGIDQISQDIVRSMGGGNTPLNARQLAATLGPTGDLRFQMQQLGMDANMQQSIQDYLTESSTQGRYVRPSEIRGRGTPGTDTIAGGEQRAAEGQMNLIASHLTEWSTGFQAGVETMKTAMDALARTIEAMPQQLKTAIFGGAGFGAGLGAGVGGAAGAALSGLVGGIGGGLAVRGGKSLVRGARNLGRRARPGLGRAARTAGRVGLRGIPIAGALLGGGMAVKNADYSGNNWSDAKNIGLNFVSLGFAGGEEGDGYGRLEQTRMPSAGWGGVAGAEMGDGEGGGRGPSTLSFLKNLLKGAPPHRITSELRPGARTTSGNVSYHASGHALDIAGPTPGRDTNEMLAINRYLANKLGQGAQELIYSGPGAINLNRGKPHQYSGRVRAIHHDHVHVAVTRESLKRIGKKLEGGKDDDEGNKIFGALTRAAQHVEKQLRDQNKRTRRNRGQGRNGFSEKKAIEDFFGRSNSQRGLISAAVDPGADLTEGKESKKGGSQGGSAGPSVGRAAIDKFLLGLRLHESDGDYTAENPRSSASGAYQYLTGTWANYRGYKTAGQAPPSIQDERARLDAGRLYDKHKDWRLVAAAHFRGEGWVAKNGDPNAWSTKDKTGGNTVPAYVKDVLQRGGLPETGDGYGGPAVAAQPGAPETALADVRAPRAHGADRGGNVSIRQSRGGSIHIAKVEVVLQTPQVSNQEARRIGKMVVEEIAREMKMKELSR